MKRHLWLLGAIAVGVGIRVAMVLLHPDMPLFGDEKIYYRAATDLAGGREVPAFPFRSPLYIWFCAGIVKLFGPAVDDIRRFQVGLEGFSILGIHLLARRMLGPRTAAWAAWLYALYPDFIAYSHYVLSETLGQALLIWGLVALVRMRDRPTLRTAVTVGLVWGLGSLNKPASLYLALPMLAWVAYCTHAHARGVALRLAAVALATLVFVIAPWSLYMSLEHDQLVIVSTTGKHNLAIGNNNYDPPHYDFPSRNTYTRARARRLARKVGLLQWISDDPGRFAERAALKLTYLWSPTSFAVRHIYWNKYGGWRRMSPALRLGAAYTVILSTMTILPLSIVGFFVARRRHPFAFGLTAAYVSPYLVMITLTAALSRYRLPLMVFAVLYAAYCLTHRGELRAQLQQARTAVPIFVVMAALVALWWDSVPTLLNALQ